MELINDVKLHLKNVRTKNSFQIHLLSRLHQVQMNFTENEVLLQKVDVKHHHPKIIKSPCFCIQIQMSPHRSASFPEFCSTVLSKTSNHSHHASYMQETWHMPTVCTGVYISIPPFAAFPIHPDPAKFSRSQKTHTCCPYV